MPNLFDRVLMLNICPIQIVLACSLVRICKNDDFLLFCSISYLFHLRYSLTISLPIKGATRYGPVDYSGTIYVKDSQGSDYLGVVFGYQSNRKFYVVMWRRENINYGKADYNAGIKGLQLKVNQQLALKILC